MLKIFKTLNELQGKDGYLVIDKSDCLKIDAVAKRILSEIGFKVSHPKMLEILKQKGYKIDGEVVKVKESQLEKLLENVKKESKNQKVVSDTIYEGKIIVGYLANQIYDAEKDVIRYPTRKDLDEATIVGLSLPEVEKVYPLFEPKDIPGYEDVLILDVFLRRVKNPERIEILNKASINKMIEMCKVVAGSKEDVIKNNMLVYYAFLISPLKYDFITIDIAFECLENGIPVRFGSPMTIAGATGPVTLAGTLSLCLAEAYTGLILSDITNQKWEPAMAPIVMDQSTGASLYSGPEKALLSMAVGDIYKYLGLGGGIGHLTQSDECKPGIQAGIEKAYSAMLFMFAGLPPTINNAGLLGPGGLVGSIEQIVIDAEIISMFNRIIRGIEVNEDTLAYEIIKKVGIEGNFLAEEHTASHFRKELWLPKIIKRLNPSAWNAERTDMLQEARKRVKKIIEENDPKIITQQQEIELNKILAEVRPP